MTSTFDWFKAPPCWQNRVSLPTGIWKGAFSTGTLEGSPCFGAPGTADSEVMAVVASIAGRPRSFAMFMSNCPSCGPKGCGVNYPSTQAQKTHILAADNRLQEAADHLSLGKGHSTYPDSGIKWKSHYSHYKRQLQHGRERGTPLSATTHPFTVKDPASGG